MTPPQCRLLNFICAFNTLLTVGGGKAASYSVAWSLNFNKFKQKQPVVYLIGCRGLAGARPKLANRE